MCCFSVPVVSVSATRIFARVANDRHQFLVYSMHLETQRSVAMVLPLPVKHGTGEHDVAFINLKDYPDFFADMEKGFPPPPPPATEHADGMVMPNSAAALEVVEVGDFQASFVPTEKDFSRLDKRFRLPEGAWKQLPTYNDYGFAVFKLKPGLQSVQPMAFSFPRRDAQSMFFPTVHIHDGKVHSKAEFDHILYCQPREGESFKFDLSRHWEESKGHAGNFMNLSRAHGLLEKDQHCYKTVMNGMLPNRDTIVALEG
jgi:hypothetical protein